MEIKMRQHLRKVSELVIRAESLKKQLQEAEENQQKWQMESTRLQIRVHELSEQNEILRNRGKEVSCDHSNVCTQVVPRPICHNLIPCFDVR